MSYNYRFIILHGTMGSPTSNWFPWIKNELVTNNYETIIPTLPTPENQNLDSWKSAFQDQVGELRERDIIIAHSISCAFALHLLASSTTAIQGLFLICPFNCLLGNPEYDQLNKSFVDATFDWEKIKTMAPEIRVYLGEDDPYVPSQISDEIAQKLDCQCEVFPDGGHLNNESGFTEFPELLDDLAEIFEL